jgi:ParB-like chromosome segregation protein Spo0J
MSGKEKEMSEEAFLSALRSTRQISPQGEVTTSPPSSRNTPLATWIKTVSEEESRTPAKAEANAVVALALEALIPPEPPPRTVYVAAHIQALAHSLLQDGQLDPLHVMISPKHHEQYWVCDGWTRVLAARQLGWSSLLCRVHDVSTEEGVWLGYRQNEARSRMCDYDRACFFEALLSQGLEAKTVCEQGRISPTSLSFLRSFSKLAPDVRSEVQKAPLRWGMNEAYALYQYQEKAGMEEAQALARRYSEAEPAKNRRWLHAQMKSAKAVVSEKTYFGNGVLVQKPGGFEMRIGLPQEVQADFKERLVAFLKQWEEGR